MLDKIYSETYIPQVNCLTTNKYFKKYDPELPKTEK